MARITGRHGTVSIGGNAIADVFNWTMEITVEAVPCPIKGEPYNTVAVGGIDVRITVERYVDSGGGSTLAKLAEDQFASLPPGTEVAYALDQMAGSGGSQITGNGVVVRGTLNAPRDLATDTLEIHGTSVPAVT
jgi:hypothetical protein